MLDDKDHIVLSVRYLNPKAIKVVGEFREPNREPLVITDNGVTMPNGSRFSRTCFGDVRTAMLIR